MAHFFICSSVKEYLFCFHVLGIVTTASENAGLQIPLWDIAFSSSGFVPESGIVDHIDSSF
jgi:hypothetical protein